MVFDVTVQGVRDIIPHVAIEDEESSVTTSMVADWLAGFGAHVALRLGSLPASTAELAVDVQVAARRIVQRYVAGDVLDSAYPAKVGRNEDSGGMILRAEAMVELDALAKRVEALDLAVATTQNEVAYWWPGASVTKAMKF